MLYQICCTITYKPIIEAIVGVIFLPSIHKDLSKFVEDFPVNVQQYSFKWHGLNPLGVTTLADYITLNYNHDIDCFWDSETNFLKEDMMNYISQKETMNKADSDYEERFQSLQTAVRYDILEQIEKEKEDIVGEHFRLSNAFGFPVGLIKTLSTTSPNSILGIFSEMAPSIVIA